MTTLRWRSVRLELSSSGEFPAGSVSRAYLLKVPLDGDDRIDAETLNRAPQSAVVQRHWATEPDENGLLVQDGPDWAIYLAGTPRMLRLNSWTMRPGELVSVIDVDGAVLPFRVASVR